MGFAVLCAVVLVGTLLQVTIGFGLGMITAPVLALVEPALVPTVNLVLACCVTAAVLVQDRASLDVRGAGLALAGRVPGVVAGALLVAFLPARPLALLMVVTVVAGVAVTVYGFRPRATRGAVVVAGAMSGMMATTTSIGGPPMAMVWARFAGPRLRSTMGAFFLVGSAMSLGALTFAGSVQAADLWYALLLVPAAAVGFVLARPIGRRLDVPRTRMAAMALSLTGAALLAVQQFT
ncbi:MAG TPA: sulfite exporter TauE/SafE family protein [Actinophytocola sp.]|uniref:sulfite exporter TauE/SafE family protein n=1 Tax=Actinophytocola sp. TaxID=1872138 RepID=UPI002F927425